MRRVGALRGAEDPIARLEPRAWVSGGVSRRCDDGAGELGARDPGQWRLVLVFASDLEQVEEVGPARGDLDEIFVGGGRGRGKVDDTEIAGAGDVGGDLNGTHGGRWGLSGGD